VTYLLLVLLMGAKMVLNLWMVGLKVEMMAEMILWAMMKANKFLLVSLIGTPRVSN